MLDLDFYLDARSPSPAVQRLGLGGLWKTRPLRQRECGVVGVALGGVGIEGLRVGQVECRLASETGGQVGVGDEELTEANGIAVAALDGRVGGLAREALVGDVDAAELLLELRA